jgi:hypothetical protein
MTRLEKLEQEIEELTPVELTALRKWFHEHDAGEWDKQIEADVLSGKLDKLAERALADHIAGKFPPVLDRQPC